MTGLTSINRMDRIGQGWLRVIYFGASRKITLCSQCRVMLRLCRKDDRECLNDSRYRMRIRFACRRTL